MWTTCPMCGKGIAVMWPQLYVYRRGEDYLCGENCMIVYDTKQTLKSNEKGVEKEVAGKLTKEHREECARIAASGGNPITYLKGLGLKNPWAAWAYIKEKARREKIHDILATVDAGKKKAEAITVEEVPEVEALEAEAAEVFKITGVETLLGSYARGQVARNVIYFRREIAEGDVIEVAMTENDWRKLAMELPKVLKTLGVEA